MSAIFLLVGVMLAAALVFGGFQTQLSQVRIASLVAAGAVLFAAFTLASFRYVGENDIGVGAKNFGINSLPPGKIIATEGEKGPQARILGPGWQPWYWPFIYKIDFTPVVEIEQGTIAMMTAADGLPLPPTATSAPPWKPGTEQQMLDAEHFLTDGGGLKGPQTSVLPPGKYRINPRLFKLETAPVLTIRKAEVGVVKSNVGEVPPAGIGNLETGDRKLVDSGQRGIWREP